MGKRVQWTLVLLAAFVVGVSTGAQGPDRGRQADAQARALAAQRNLDARLGLLVPVVAPAAAQQVELDALRALMPDVRIDVDRATGATRSLWNLGGYLTGADGRAARAIADDFIASRIALLGLTAADVVDMELTDEVHSPLSGVTHLYYRQRVNGVPVYNAQLHVNVTREGRILSVNNAFLPEITSAVGSLRPGLGADAAVRRAAAHLGQGDVVPNVSLPARGARQATQLEAPALSRAPITAELMIVPIRRGQARLAWNFQVWTTDGEHAFDFTVDAESGAIWTRTDWVAADQYRVYPQPVESPNHSSPLPPADGRVLVADPAHPIASPFGWHDTNGAVGAEFTTTEGNNVSAYTDTDGNNVPDSGSSPDCGPGLACDFAISLASEPSSYRPAAVTNLFYWNNVIHDIQYRYGFDEAAGNFQVNNYGRGGAGGDSVQAEAQDGPNVNNANFATPPDGQRPRMQMFLFTAPTPDIDGDLDAGVVVHEYAHGISNRLVGGPSNVNCLANAQQPGEGISDWLALVHTALPSHTGLTPRGIGTYILNQPAGGAGIRTQRYSTDSSVNTFSYASISGGLSAPHGVGSVWAQGMWEVYWALVDHYGFSPDLYDATGGAGNQRAMLYHTEGLKNTACSPGFTQVRDGIIQAAQTINAGQDVCRLWSAFAAFGLGTNAVNPSPSSNAGIVNGFDVPVACGGTGNPAMSIDDVSVSEGNSGTTTAIFTVSLATAPTSEARVNFVVAPGTASIGEPTSGGDVAPAGGQLIFPPGTQTRTVNVTVHGDTLIEPDETFVVNLSSAVNATLVDAQGIGTIVNDDLTAIPESQDDSYATAFNTPLTVQAPGVLANDSVNGGAFLDALLVSGPSHGVLTLARGGGFTYAPTPGFTGQDTFAYRAENDFGTGNAATVTLVVGAGVPTSINDSYGTPSGTTLEVTAPGALGNDLANGGGELTAVLVAGTNHGVLTLSSNGGFTYQPDGDYTGGDAFSYRASNAVGVGAIATVSLSISATVPTTSEDRYSTQAGVPLISAVPGVLANDSSNGGGPLSAQLVSQASNGTVALGANGSFTYVPSPGFVGNDAFAYRALNGLGPGNVAVVSLTVTQGAPATANDALSTTYPAALNLAAPGVLANDSANGGGALTAVLVTNVSNGTLSLGANGSVSYTPNFGFAGNDSFTYRAVSPAGSGNAATVTITVAPPTTVQPPYNLRVDSVAGTLVTLRWDALPIGPQASTFVLEGGIRDGEVLASIPTGSPSPIFTFVAPTGSWSIRMHGQLGSDKSPASNEAALHVNVPVTPSAPRSLLGLVNGTTLDLAWKNTFEGGPPSSMVLDVTGSATVSLPMGPTERFSFNPVPGGSYTFRVRQTNAGGSSAASDPVSLSFPAGCTAPPEVPANFLGYRVGSTAFVIWDPPATGAAPTSYLLDVSGSFVGTFPTAGRSLSGAVSSGNYQVRVQAVNACGASAFTATQVIHVP